MSTEHRIYNELASWWPLLSKPADYAEEATSFLSLLALPPSDRPRTLLELGSGGGNLASHLAKHFRCTLSDLSPSMLAVSKQLNPALEHVQGDLRSLRLERSFDLVLVHDAIMYCTTLDDLRAAITTANTHCAQGGTVLVAPDFVRETFEPSTDHGGEDGEDGRALRYLEWCWDPDPSDTTIETSYTVTLREPNGSMRVELDRHTEGLFSLSEWQETFASVGLSVRPVVDAWNRHVFVGVKDSR